MRMDRDISEYVGDTEMRLTEKVDESFWFGERVGFGPVIWPKYSCSDIKSMRLLRLLPGEIIAPMQQDPSQMIGHNIILGHSIEGWTCGYARWVGGGVFDQTKQSWFGDVTHPDMRKAIALCAKKLIEAGVSFDGEENDDLPF